VRLSDRRDSNPQHKDWKSFTLPLSYCRKKSLTMTNQNKYGENRIRTCGSIKIVGLVNRCIKPLCHLSSPYYVLIFFNIRFYKFLRFNVVIIDTIFVVVLLTNLYRCGIVRFVKIDFQKINCGQSYYKHGIRELY
jgi:hypothetical protein